MKKIFAAVLAAVLLLSLGGCGKKVEYVGSDLYVTVEGIGTKKAILTVSGDLSGYTGISAGVPADVEQQNLAGTVSVQAPFSAEEKSRDAQLVRYQLRAVAPGSSTMTVALMEGGKEARTVEATISVSAEKKFYAAVINIREDNDIFSGFSSGSSDGEMTAMEGASSQMIRIASDRENWRVRTFDPEVVYVTEGVLADGYIQWNITAEKAGDTIVEFANSDDGSKLYVTVLCTEGEDGLLLEIVNTEAEHETAGLNEDEIIAKTSQTVIEFEQNEAGEEIAVEQEKPVIEGMFIPKSGKVIESAGGILGKGEDAEVDSAEMELELNGKHIIYVVTKAFSLDEYIKNATEGLKITSSDEFDVAGRHIHYLCYEASFAAWEENGNVCVMYIIGKEDGVPDPVEDKKVIEDFLK